MSQIQRNNVSATSGNATHTSTYIRPLAKRKGAIYPRTILSLSVILLLSLGVLLAMISALHYRTERHAAAVMALESQIAEQKMLLELAAAEAMAISPLEEPKLGRPDTTSTTKKLTDIDSGYGVLIDVQENVILASKSHAARIYPASMTKVMTLIVAVEHIADINAMFTFDYTITDPAYEAGASVAGFSAGESVPLIDVLYGAALPSGADATMALAVVVAENEAVFAELMNKKAEEIGLTETHFMNASGLHHPDHYSTPLEMAMIMEYAMQIPLLKEILSTYQYTTTPTAQHPEGLLLTSTMFSRVRGDEAGNCTIIAGKTGYTPEAGQCLVSMAATPDGRRFVLVTSLAVGKYAPIYDAIDVYKNYIPAAES